MTENVFEGKIEENKPHTVTVSVNGRQITFKQHAVSGMDIKQTAIAQGVPIQPDFVLFELKPGDRQKQVLNDEVVHLHPGQEFSAVAPDDNSGEES